jgi:glycosyltransferase involved in cell wall biosynthesis
MRVLLLTADYPPRNWSGIGVAVARQAHALAALGLEVHVLVAGRDDEPLPADTGSSPFVHRLSPSRCPVDPRRFDLIHLHSLALSELALELRRRTRSPLVYTAHGLIRLELGDRPEAGFWSAVQACVLAASDRVVFLSAADRRAGLDWLPDLAARSSVLPHGLPPPPATVARPPPDGPIVFAGRFAWSKGVDLLAELIPRVRRQRPCRFVLAGGHGDALGERLTREIAAHWPEAVQLWGWRGRDELDLLFGRAALVLVPSRYEPFGLVALEAMRVGAPVLAAAVGGLADHVRPESGGRLVASRDPAAWSAAVLEIVTEPTTAAALRQRGPRYVAEHFDLPRLTRRLIDEVYAPLAPRPSLGRASPVRAAAVRQLSGAAP